MENKSRTDKSISEGIAQGCQKLRRSVEQRAARAAQKQLGCSYNSALITARSNAAKEMASADKSPIPFREKLAASVVKIMSEGRPHRSEFDAVWDDVRENR